MAGGRFLGFRGFTAPASLEQRIGVLLVPFQRRFPGLYRPGLIGAGGAWAACRGRGVGFRGFTAPASLEHACLLVNAIVETRVSGALPPRPHWSGATTRPGMASRSPVSGALPPRPHWSRRAVLHVRTVHPRFPGLYRPGLIGACRLPRVIEHDTPRFPGLYRPGLIGADSATNARGTLVATVSGALPPRPHWSCTPPRTHTRRARPVSGALPPRPHWSPLRPFLPSGVYLVSGALPPRPHWSNISGHQKTITNRGFRGFTAPASLEPGVSGLAWTAAHRFPGLYRPGLIGAGFYAAAWLRTRTGFRGFTAPASLELGGGHHQLAGDDGVSGALPPRPHWSRPRTALQ